MLPSTGLFNLINCPFYDNKVCTRPYCHFKHAKKEEQISNDILSSAIEQPQLQILEPPIVYKPTPKYILELSTKSSTITSNSLLDEKQQQRQINLPVAKKPKLEYIPKLLNTTNDNKTPIYKPSPSVNSLNSIEYDIIEEDLSNYTTENINQKPIYIPTKIIKDSDKLKTDENKSIDKSNIDNDTEKKNSNENNKCDIEENSSKDKGKHKSNSSSNSINNLSKSSHSHSSNRRHKSSSSSSSSHKSSRTNNDSKSTPSSSSSSSSKHKSSSSSRSNNRSNSKNDHNSSKSSHKSSKSKSSTSSSTKINNRDRSTAHDKDIKVKSIKDVQRDKLKKNNDLQDNLNIFNNDSIPSPSSLFDSEEEDECDADEILKQCKMIFNEYESTTTTTTENIEQTKEQHLKVNNKNDDDNGNMDEKYPVKSSKKRIAFENANNVHSRYKLKQPPPLPITNHIKNAMHAVYSRQEIMRKQYEEQKLKEETEEKAKTEKIKSLILSSEIISPSTKLSALHKSISDKMNNHNNSINDNVNNSIKQSKAVTSTLSPLITPTSTTFSKYASRIAPITNMAALAKVKERIDKLKASKNINNTIVQTVSKSQQRIAHINPTIATNSTTKLAPPVLEVSSTKISYNIRMQYYNIMVKHCINIYDNCDDAWQRAQSEELAVFKKCNTAVIYKSSALLTINKLRKESADAGNVNTEKNNVISHDVILAGKLGLNTSWNINKKKLNSSNSNNIIDTASAEKVYEMIFELSMTEEQLKENGYPRKGSKSGMAKIYKLSKATPCNENDRYCRRCGKIFKLEEYDEPAIDKCNYHSKSPGFRRGFADNAHLCCQQPAGSPGCMYANYHVTDYIDNDNLIGFITTLNRTDKKYIPTRKDIYALDCEMCYTTNGMELTRITVIDINLKVVYDAFVKPDNRIIDYNTVYSGISEDSLKNVTRTIRDVQAVLLSMFHSKTILIGHSLESDFKALKLVHDVVVDTSVLYPHKMGFPKKRALKTLCIENLKRIIQENESGHDSAEDAEVCILLIKHYLRNRML